MSLHVNYINLSTSTMALSRKTKYKQLIKQYLLKTVSKLQKYHVLMKNIKNKCIPTIMCQMGFLVGTHPQANPARPSAHGEDRGLPSRLPAMAAEHIQASRPCTHGHLTNHHCDSRLCSDPLLSPRHVNLYNNHHDTCCFLANIIYNYIQQLVWLNVPKV